MYTLIFANSMLFLSTLSLRRATHGSSPPCLCSIISIHALLAESDLTVYRITVSIMDFYPRSPCGERLQYFTFEGIIYDFYPRSPCGERLVRGILRLLHRDFYPRSPCGERRSSAVSSGCCTGISIHALLAESDQPDRSAANGVSTFLSTLSLRRATQKKCAKTSTKWISIHALLAESDGAIRELP